LRQIVVNPKRGTKKAQECHRAVKPSKNSLLENQTIHGRCKLGDLALPPNPFPLSSPLHTARPALILRPSSFTAALRSRR
jgi:hypothetical protein